MRDAPATLPAEHLDGETAHARPVELRFTDPEGLRLARPDGTFAGFWPYAGLQVETLGADVTELRHEDRPGAVLVCRDPALRTLLHMLGVGPRPPLLGGHPALKAVGLLAVLGALCLGIYLGISPAARWLAHRVPRGVEARMATVFDRTFEEHACHTPEADAALASLVQRLQPLPTDAQLRVSIVNVDVLNAFALPGDRVVLTRALVEKADGPDEVAAVLAHELEHVERRHVMTHVVRSSILSIGWAVTMGDYAGLMVIDPSTAFEIATLQFSRDDEREADAGALARLDAAAISRAGFERFFARLGEEGADVPGALGFLSSHPTNAERIQSSSQGAAERPARPALDAQEWSALRAACGERPPRSVGLGDLF